MNPPNESLTHGNKHLTAEDAAEIALQALIYFANDEQQLGRFLNLTGLSPDHVREQAQSQQFQASILDYLMSDESLLLVFAANHNIDPALIGPARDLLDPRLHE